MIINNLGSNGNTKSHEILAHCQTVSNFFIDALEQNDCTLKIVVGYYFDIQDSKDTLEDILEATVIQLKDFAPKNKKSNPKLNSSYSGKPQDVAVSPPGVEAAVQALKARCFHCRLRLPKIKFEKDFRFTYNKLSFQLEIYKNVFKIDKPRLINYCHVSFGLQKACLPDILKIIAMLLTAFSSILALKKLPKISLGVFVKAIIGKLMAAVIANVKISIDMSQTGVPCILSAIEEIARAIPTKEEVYNLPMSDEVRDNLFPREPYQTISGKTKQPFVPYSVFEQTQKEKLRNKEITREQYDQELKDYRKANEPLRYYASQLRSQTEMKMDQAEEKISEAFSFVSDTVTKAQDDINSYIQSLLGVIEYFECENARTGADFSEVLAYIKNLQDVINLFSSIMGKYITKLFEPLLCADNMTPEKIRETLEKEPLPQLTNADLADIIQDFTGTEAKLDDDGVSILLYDKPVKSRLPKLELLGCNVKEFADAHKIENVIKTIVNDSVNNGDSSTRPVPYKPYTLPPIPTIPKAPPSKPPVVLFTKHVFKPNKVELPKFARDPVSKVPLTVLTSVINRSPLPPGTKFRYPTYKNPVFPTIGSYVPARLPPYIFNIVKTTGTLPKNIKPFVDYIKNTKNNTSNPPSMVIPLPTGNKGINTPGFKDELDILVDFIYNPPDLKKGNKKEEDDLPVPEHYIDVSPDMYQELDTEDLQGILRGTGTLSEEKQRRSSKFSQKECKTFDDVLDILNTLRV